ncbi:MAG: putative dienelactone hydrolase [Verrucomicrobiales bacterium]|jgi:predicted dienelactone hydrolase
MMTRTALAIFLVLALGAGACSADGSDANTVDVSPVATDPSTTTPAEPTDTTAAPTTTTAPPTTLLPTLELIGLGEHDVGVTTIIVGETTERPLTVDVWFPIGSAGELPDHEYTFFPGIFYRSPNALTATFDDLSTAGPFPLIVYSHGTGGQRFIHSNYVETLASHGYVVVSADHMGDTLVESLTGAAGDIISSIRARPDDIRNVLDAVLGTLDETEASRALETAISNEPVVMTGHSLGGFTSYAVVGGIETDAFTVESDDRIGAVITLAPFATLDVLPDETLANINVPQLIIVGSDDKTTPIDPNVERPWALSPGSPAYRVELAAGEHLTFTDMCDYVTFLPELGTVPDFIVSELDTRSALGCSPDDMAIERAQDLTNTFAVRFLDAFYDDEPFIDPGTEILPDDIVFDAR